MRSFRTHCVVVSAASLLILGAIADIVVAEPMRTSVDRYVSGRRDIAGVVPDSFETRERSNHAGSSSSELPVFMSTHEVKPGEQLSQIASRYHMPVKKLLRLNPEVVFGELAPGTTLVVLVTGAFPSEDHDDFFRLVDGPGYQVRRSKRAWAKLSTIRLLQRVFSAYHSQFPKAPTVRVFDLSKEGGGDLPPHVSHDKGVDVDIPYIVKRRYAGRVLRTEGHMLDLKRMWFFLRSLIRTNQVEYIFMDHDLQSALYSFAKTRKVPDVSLDQVFQYPRAPEVRVGLIRDDPGHDTHFHVRFIAKSPIN